MSLPIPRNVAIQSSSRNLTIYFFTDEEIAKIFDAIQERAVGDKRHAAYHKRYFLLAKVLLRTGARISEALMLKPTDVNLATNTIRLRTLKQGSDKNGIRKEKYRTIPLHPDLRDAYMQYLLEFNINQKGEDLLFRMKRQPVDRYFKGMEPEMGIKIYAHKFRHTFGVKAMMDNVPLNVVQQWMGHSSIFTTSIYLQITGLDTSQFMERVR